MTAREVLDRIEQRAAEAERHVTLCGPCDGGLPMECTYATTDPREEISELITAARAQNAALRAVLDLHRDIDGDGTCASCANWDESERVIVSTGRAADLAPEVMLPCPTVRAITDALGTAR